MYKYSKENGRKQGIFEKNPSGLCSLQKMCYSISESLQKLYK